MSKKLPKKFWVDWSTGEKITFVTVGGVLLITGIGLLLFLALSGKKSDNTEKTEEDNSNKKDTETKGNAKYYNSEDEYDNENEINYSDLTDEQYGELEREYGGDVVDAFIEQLHDDECTTDIDEFDHWFRIENYGLTDDQMDSGDDD